MGNPSRPAGAPLPGILQKDFICGAVEFFLKYDYYDIYESRKISKQKIVLTGLEILQFCVLF
jgi:hypothetical protein